MQNITEGLQNHLQYLQGFVDIIDSIALNNAPADWTMASLLLLKLKNKLQEVVSHLKQRSWHSWNLKEGKR